MHIEVVTTKGTWNFTLYHQMYYFLNMLYKHFKHVCNIVLEIKRGQYGGGC